MQVNGRPVYVCSCCDTSLKRLDVQFIDLYYQHQVDTKVPIEETISDLVLSTTWLQRVISCLQFEIIKFPAN